MGWIIPPPYEPPPSLPGNPCSICWGIGKAFGDDDTPIEIYINVSGVNKTDLWTLAHGEPPEGRYKLDQTPGVPCFYSVIFDNRLFIVQFWPTTTDVFIEFNGLYTQFQSNVSPACNTFVSNEVTDFFTGGTCEIEIPSVQS